MRRGKSVEEQGYFTMYQLAHYADLYRTNIKSHIRSKANILKYEVKMVNRYGVEITQISIESGLNFLRNRIIRLEEDRRILWEIIEQSPALKSKYEDKKKESKKRKTQNR